MLDNKEFYEYAKKYALGKLIGAYQSEKGASQAVAVECAQRHLNLLIKPDVKCDINNPKTTLNDIYCRLLVSCQNRREMPDVIKFDYYKDIFARLLYQFNAERILAEYAESEEKVLQAFTNEKIFKINKEKIAVSWRCFSQSVISGAKFISKFKSVGDFKQFIDYIRKYFPKGMTVPEFMSGEIYGLGKILACDFLKEIGYVDYPKPDVHIKCIISGCFYKGKEISPEKIMSKVQEIAESAGVSAFEVDKILWLIGSGKYYEVEDIKEIKITNSSKNKLRDEFLRQITD